MSALLVSDREREHTVALLRDHLLCGRLTVEEFEQRVAETWRARFAADLWHALRWLPVEAPPAPRRGGGQAAASLVLGIAGLSLLVLSLGLLFLITLPLSATAWGLGREARRSGAARGRGAAVAGEALGIAGTVAGLIMFAGCAALLSAVL